MSFPKNTFVALTMLQSFVCLGQSSKPDIMIGIGSSINILNQQNRNDWSSLSYSTNVGIFTKRALSDKYSVLFGLIYRYSWTDNYLNTVNFTSNWTGGPEQSDVNLKTSFRFQSFEIPIVLKRYYMNNKFSVGVGVNFSYLTFAKFSQDAIGNYSMPNYPLADAAFDAEVKFVYGVKEYVTVSPFSKTNIAPILNLGYSFSKRFSLEYFMMYDLISNPILNYKFNNYNTLTNNLILTFKLN